MSTIPVDEKVYKLKDPGDTLDFGWDWTDWLPAGDLVASVVATITGSTATVDSDGVDPAGKIVTALVSGGAAGETARLNFRCTLQSGKVVERSMYLKIKER